MEEQRIREIIREELTNFGPPKKKRAPSKWQLFLKECVKKQDEDIKYTEKVQLCSVEYKEMKKTNNPSLTNNSSSINNSSSRTIQKEDK